MKLLVSTRGPCWAVAGQDRHFASQPHGVELNHPCGLTVDGTSPSASMCPSPSRVRLRQRTAPSRSEDALIRGGHPGTRCMTRLTVTGNECRRRVNGRKEKEGVRLDRDTYLAQELVLIELEDTPSTCEKVLGPPSTRNPPSGESENDGRCISNLNQTAPDLNKLYILPPVLPIFSN
ncbi:hypothetical protein WN48_00946 [Eufriesea mexicana]|nr:hypothetical protein WN48_00946 [Eufriesea mexicana]